LSTTPYYIVITRENQALLSFLKITVIVDGKLIYPLLTNQPVVIPVSEDHPKVVVTDGFHFTKPIELAYSEPSYYNFKVGCAIDDQQLLAGAFLLVFFYLMGFFTDWLLLKILSFAPVIYFLFLYYFKRKKFIQITPA
jgi:hypothetical protein